MSLIWSEQQVGNAPGLLPPPPTFEHGKFLLGPAAATVALGLFATTVSAAMAVAISYERDQQLKGKMPRRRQRRAALQRKQQTMDAALVSNAEQSSMPPARRRRTKKRSKVAVHNIMEFFIADEASEVSEAGEDGPFQLDESFWQNPTGTLVPVTGEEEHFIGDPAAVISTAGVHEFADELWCSPSATAAATAAA
eukprot:CAMPEP_0172755952 /NCGR_PEP_ID=MMETSP1074-20121228/160835_1 /TAXON_ID=2916 /ORGANISM="Ceratium fusus, Strain PA161109" /LENGTH=194 /DNA_ID=CAMNT_0013589133 /DNA_START=30 /DNA_END=610 /DNA_ORIENTATION=+